MRDLTISGRIGADSTFKVTFRTDLVNASSNNCNVSEIRFRNSEDERMYNKYLNSFQKANTSVAAMKAFCTSNNLTLRSANSDGSDLTTLYLSTDDDSSQS